MGLVEGVSDLGAVAQHLIGWQRAFLESLGQRLALEVLHHQEHRAVLLAHVVERADVRMVQA